MMWLLGAVWYLSAAPAVAAPTYLTADRIIDPATGRVTDNPALIIEDGKIKAFGEQANLPAPDGAVLVDLSGRTILPGFIDMHTHLTIPPRRGGVMQASGLPATGR